MQREDGSYSRDENCETAVNKIHRFFINAFPPLKQVF